jgi:RimJ/RimL family protein N-acetyltransferase
LPVQTVCLDPDRLGERDVLDVTAVYAAADAVDRPEWPAESPEAIAGRLRTAHLGSDPVTFWVGRLADGRAAVVGLLELPAQENLEQAAILIRVHPELRRQGHGTEMLRVLAQQAREAGRTRLLGANVREGGPGEPWVKQFGFERAQTYIVQELAVARTDPALWQGPAVPGYRLYEWTGTAPQELLESYAAARQAISDAPAGQLTWATPQWTAQRVRREEAAHAAVGAEQRVVVSVHEATGEVVGLTELLVYARQPQHARQFDTAVLAAHRGHGLGRAMKAAMMRRLVRERPEVERISTQTAKENVWMAQVNHGIGYRTLWTHFHAEADLITVEARLGV